MIAIAILSTFIFCSQIAIIIVLQGIYAELKNPKQTVIVVKQRESDGEQGIDFNN
jgi:hypothetical protein